jgi:hypothetical protein
MLCSPRISRTCWRPIGGDVVEQLRRRHEPALWAQFEQGQAAQAKLLPSSRRSGPRRRLMVWCSATIR